MEGRKVRDQGFLGQQSRREGGSEIERDGVVLTQYDRMEGRKVRDGVVLAQEDSRRKEGRSNMRTERKVRYQWDKKEGDGVVLTQEERKHKAQRTSRNKGQKSGVFGQQSRREGRLEIDTRWVDSNTMDS